MNTFAAVYKFAEAAFARSITPFEAELLGELIDEYDLGIDDWREVFKTTARYNVRNLRYVEGILKNRDRKQGWYEKYQEHIER